MGVRRLSIAAIVSLGALAFAGSAQACSCVETPPREALFEADAAIVGRLISVTPRDSDSADYRYRVGRVYKRGEGIRRGRTVVVRSGIDGASCGLPGGVGQRYGLFLGWIKGGWIGSDCRVISPQELARAAQARSKRDLRATAAVPLSCAS